MYQQLCSARSSTKGNTLLDPKGIKGVQTTMTCKTVSLFISLMYRYIDKFQEMIKDIQLTKEHIDNSFFYHFELKI